MRFPSEGGRQLDSVILLFLFALFLLVSPVREWWASDQSLWFMPYLLWAGIIGLTYKISRRRGHHDL
jgi:hypothetical protein